jgi:hypothetical protein
MTFGRGDSGGSGGEDRPARQLGDEGNAAKQEPGMIIATPGASMNHRFAHNAIAALHPPTVIAAAAAAAAR